MQDYSQTQNGRGGGEMLANVSIYNNPSSTVT